MFQLLKVSSRWITNPKLFFPPFEGNSRLDAKSMLVLIGFQRETLFFPNPSKLIYSPEKSNETAAATNATMWWKRTKNRRKFRCCTQIAFRTRKSEEENHCWGFTESLHIYYATIFITQPKAYVFPRNQQFSGWAAIADSTFTFKTVWVAKIHLGNILSMLLSNANVCKFFY